MSAPVDALLSGVAVWAANQDDVRAVVLLGSQAREAVPADEFSDVDLVLLVDDPARRLRDPRWVETFGEPLLTFLEPTSVGGFQERRVLYRDGLEVDFSVLPASIAESMPAEAADVFARGHRVLYDELDLRYPAAEPAAPPAQEELDQLSHDFWYHVLLGAKKLRRGEVLLAKQVCDCYLVSALVELARRQAFGRDTWHGFRFFERWAGGDVVERLPETFSRYEPADVARALRATAELYALVEDDVAARFGLAVTADRGEVLRLIDGLLGSVPKEPVTG